MDRLFQWICSVGEPVLHTAECVTQVLDLTKLLITSYVLDQFVYFSLEIIWTKIIKYVSFTYNSGLHT